MCEVVTHPSLQVVVELLQNAHWQLVLNEVGGCLLRVCQAADLVLLRNGDVHQVADALPNDSLNVDPFRFMAHSVMQVLKV